MLKTRLIDSGIDIQHADTLYVIGKREGLTQKELSNMLMVGKSAMTQSINKLVSLGLVSKEVDRSDRRSSRIYLTEKGKSIVPELDKVFEEFIELHTSSFTDKEQEQLEVLLTKLMKQLWGENAATK